MVVCGMSVEGSLVGPDRGQLRWIGRVVVFILPDRNSALLTVGLQSSELCDIGRAPLLVRVDANQACLPYPTVWADNELSVCSCFGDVVSLWEGTMYTWCRR